MMKIPPSFLDLLRERVLLSEIIRPYVKLTRKGREYQGLCPFHKEKTPSFSVKDDKRFYHCFGCGAHGDGVEFLMRHQGLGFLEAVETLARGAGLAMPLQKEESPHDRKQRDDLYAIHQEATSWFRSQLTSREGQEAQAYLKRRGVSPEISQVFQLGYAPPQGFGLGDFLVKRGYKLPQLLEAGVVVQKGGGAQDRFRHRLIFPITDRRGRIIAFGGRTLGEGIPKYLNSSDTPLFNKGETLYGLPLAEKAVREEKAPLVVVEGYMDVVSLYQGGVTGVVASLGTALTETQMGMLWRLSPEPFLSFDGDGAGQRASFRALERALPLLRPGYSFNFIDLPQGEDPDSLVSRGGRKAWDEVMKGAQPFREVLWSRGLQSQRLDTPERRAGGKQALFQLVAQIKDPDIRHEYQLDMDKKWQILTQGPINGNKKRGMGGGAGRVTLPTTPELMQQRILLAIPLQHPPLIQTICEVFAGLTFGFQPYEILKQKIILAFEIEKNLDRKELHSYLCKRGESETLADILRPEVFLHAAVAREEASLEEALKGWFEVWGRYQGQKFLLADVKEAQDTLQHTMTAESWRRLRILKEMTLAPSEEHSSPGDEN
jgi:DNA primase